MHFGTEKLINDAKHINEMNKFSPTFSRISLSKKRVPTHFATKLRLTKVVTYTQKQVTLSIGNERKLKSRILISSSDEFGEKNT